MRVHRTASSIKSFLMPNRRRNSTARSKSILSGNGKKSCLRWEGNDTVDILIDTRGKTCFISTKGNLTGITPYDIRYAVANMPDWTPGLQNHVAINFRAHLAMSCINGKFDLQYLNEKALKVK